MAVDEVLPCLCSLGSLCALGDSSFLWKSIAAPQKKMKRTLERKAECLAQLSSERCYQQLMEADAETHSQTSGGVRESCRGGGERSVGARRIKDFVGRVTESTNLGS